MAYWNEDSKLCDTCASFHCKYFALEGCKHPYSEDCRYENGYMLYWPWDVVDEISLDNYRLIKMFNKTYTRTCFHKKRISSEKELCAGAVYDEKDE